MAQANVNKARKVHERKQAARDTKLNQQRRGTVGSDLNDATARAFGSNIKRRNS